MKNNIKFVRLSYVMVDTIKMSTIADLSFHNTLEELVKDNIKDNRTKVHKVKYLNFDNSTKIHTFAIKEFIDEINNLKK